VKKLPIKAALFPNIVDVETPTIELIEKGKAMTQLIYSTILQMGDMADSTQVQKLISFLGELTFYQINLSSDLKVNVKTLRNFINNLR
jgi:hypothetical protein